MPKFAYVAIDATGADGRGATKADTIGDVRVVARRHEPVPDQDRGAPAELLDFELTQEKVKKKELMHFTRQLAVFVKAGIPITDALDDDRRRDRGQGPAACDRRHGRRSAQRGRRSPTPRPPIPRSSRTTTSASCRSAELTGQLDESLDSLAGYLDREIETRSKVVAALVYPAVVMVMAFVTVLILAGYRAAAVQAAVRGARRRPAAADADAALLRPVLHRPLVHHRRLRRWSSAASLMFLCRCTRAGGSSRDSAGPARSRSIGGHHRVRDPRALLPDPVDDGQRPACRCRTAMETTTESTNNVVYRERLEVARQQMLEGRRLLAAR